MESEFHELMTSRKVSRRDLFKFAGWSMAIFGVAGPSVLMRPYKAEAGKVAKPVKAPSPQGNIVLTYSDISGPEHDYRRAFATDYLAENPEVEDILFDNIPYNEGLEKQLVTLRRDRGLRHHVDRRALGSGAGRCGSDLPGAGAVRGAG
jgi:hypothetical protein